MPKKRDTGLPGVQQEDTVLPLQATRQTQDKIGKKEIARAIEILTQYKQGRSNFEARIVEDERWWQMRHWDVIRRGDKSKNPSPEPTSAWLFNAIVNKHADAMDNYPEPVVLPREKTDEESAKMLSAILPVVMEYNDYEKTYANNWWEKLKHGTAAYGVFWDSKKDNGLGDIDIQPIDLLNIFWEPGITDIQASRNLFIVALVDEDLLDQQYPDKRGKLGGQTIDVKQYVYDDTIDTSHKSVVVDWYYKVLSPSGQTILHYAKFVGTELLYASENDPEYRESGWYDHGMYPVVLDTLYPEKGTPAGFGYVAICKDPQIYIDKLFGNILENSLVATKRRFFASTSTNINKDQFMDLNEPIVDVEGELDDRRLREIEYGTLSDIYVTVAQLKIDEMKETASNRDVSQGSTSGGVTAAAAISALQEAGNKASRDMINASYRCHVQICTMCIELMRQFYDETRSFRITGTMPGSYQFVDINNAQIQDQVIGADSSGIPIYRRPVFDLKIKAQKRNPFSRMEQNERAKELYGLGFFNPERAQEASGALEMMDFEGIDKVKEQVQQGQTLLNICQQMSAQMDQMAAIIQSLTGKNMGIVNQAEPTGRGNSVTVTPNNHLADGIMQANTPKTGYAERLAKRSTPSVEGDT